MKQCLFVGWMFVGLVILVIGVFFGLLVLLVLVLSIIDFDLYLLLDSVNLWFVGLGNYIDLLQILMFWKLLWNIIYFVIVGVLLFIGVLLGVVMLFNVLVVCFKVLFCMVLFVLVVIILVVVVVIWCYLFYISYGLVNYGLGYLGISLIDWFGDFNWVMLIIMLFVVWKNFGYNMVIFLVGLQVILYDLYEVVCIDGVLCWKQFLYIILLMFGLVLLVVGVIIVFGYFQLFVELYVMICGDLLQSIVSVLYFMFEEGFKWWNLGCVFVVVFLLFLIILVVIMLMLCFGCKRQLV